MSIVVLISGGGSNLQAIIDACEAGQIDGKISAVISNKSGAFGLERAKNAGIETQVLDHKTFEDRESFDQALIKVIDQYKPKLVVLAGFMRILTQGFTEHYLGKMINIHPSLLPKYQGLHTHQRAIDAKDDVAGVSVHFVTAQLDGGPVIIQAQVPLLPNDDATTLAKRVLVEEHKIYPLVCQWFLENRLSMKDNLAMLDNKPLPVSGFA